MTSTKLSMRVEHALTAVPDTAALSLGVETTAAEVEEATATNAAAMRRVLSAIKANGIADADIRTTYVVLSALNSPRDQPPLRIVGYVASNAVEIAVRDLDNLPLLIEQATAAGSNNIRGLKFSVRNASQLLDEARAEALKKAIARAQLYAGVAGLSVAHIVEIRDEYSEDRSGPPRLRKAAAAPVEAGEIELVAGLEVIFELTRQ